MDWIKRNLILVIGVVVALVFLTAASVFLVAGMSEHDRVTQELDTAKAELQRLYTANPSPVEENVKLVAEDRERLVKLVSDARSRFAVPPTENYDVASFKKLLDNTIFELTRDAEISKVRLPERYNFTFDVQKSAVSFPPGSIQPLAGRLGEIKTICKILFNARVHSLDGMRRVLVSADDREGSADYLLQRAVTNDVAKMVRIPYEVTFSGFSQELAAVLDGLASAPEFFVVRDIWAAPAPIVVSAASPVATAIPVIVPGFPQRPATPASDDCSPSDCCCCNPKPKRPTFPSPTAAPQYVYAPRAAAVPNTILNERLLRFTLTFEVIVPPSEATAFVTPASAISAPVVPPSEE